MLKQNISTSAGQAIHRLTNKPKYQWWC